MSFEELSLSEPLLRALTQKGYNTPTPIQAQTIPLILERQDIMGSAQTGTGKTAGFTLPMLQLLSAQPFDKGRRAIKGLILVPTRELALQVEQSVKAYGKYLPLVSLTVFGGVRIGAQIAKLRQNTDILIATPGRLVDLLEQRKVNLSQVEMFVLDEADRLLDMGFINDIRKIMDVMPAERQNVLFSATSNKRVTQLGEKLLNEPVKVTVASTNATSDNVTQRVHSVDRAKKFGLLLHLIESEELEQLLVFTKTKRSADQLSDQLNDEGIFSDTFHGDMQQRARVKALDGFKRGRTSVLVATDVAARGIDIDQLSHVINYELPHSAEDYIHRIGRTGRAGNKGHAISFVAHDEKRIFNDIKKLIKSDIEATTVEGFEPSQNVKKKQPFHAKKRSNAFQPQKKKKYPFPKKPQQRRSGPRAQKKRA